jgi:hypothetical protein
MERHRGFGCREIKRLNDKNLGVKFMWPPEGLTQQ